MADQADHLRRLVRQTLADRPALEPGVPLVALSGGKQGVGTTTLAISLVQELAQLGKKVVLVEGDLLQPSIAHRLEIKNRGSLTELLEGSRSLPEVMETVSDSIRLVPGHASARTATNLSRESVRRLITELRTSHQHADIVVIDTGGGMSPWTAELWRAAEQVWLLTTPDSEAVMASYAAVKLSPHAELENKLRLLVNRCDSHEQAASIAASFRTTCRRFLQLAIRDFLPIANQTPRSSAVASGSSKNHFSRSVRLLAAEVLSHRFALSSTTRPQAKKDSTNFSPMKK